jgi:hypothetical protein
MWLQDADEVAEGVFAREDIEAGTFLLDFGELNWQLQYRVVVSGVGGG